ncbi:hypothetical protein [Dyella terrae]|uniref:hypothetical protein n=1 Tax=Dyella terrae TaxID=522259 RepID=UPI001EFCCC2E|nr:hypothetical protein [Dyella terrae]ULU24455.1 hypothetical protein DYST_01371 [Dyella terrae]
MKTWQVLGYGEGFVRGERVLGFELSGLVFAEGPNEAFKKAIALAKREWPEISQADKEGFPRPVINADEVDEVTGQLIIDGERVELFWDDQADN